MANKRHAKHNQRGRNASSQERFARMPHYILHSLAYRSLTPNARCLLLELLSIFHGDNNGSIYLSVRDAQKRIGLNNTTSTSAAFDDLIEAGFLKMTQASHFAQKASDSSRARCWRLTWLHAKGAGKTDEWQKFQPSSAKSKKRGEAGMKAIAEFKRNSGRNKFPVLETEILQAKCPP